MRLATIARLAGAGFALALGLGLTPMVGTSGSAGHGAPALIGFGAAPAAAQTVRAVSRRTARRTSRRTSRRQAYIHSLPGGCVLRGGYHYCGGVYYRPVVQNGATVYVVVTP
ncbi:hypothetical protein LNKW23_07680 [Paralimibaculum aggregatum]|uniref:Uncharacterized protein n=1 Tax=Paralimibaculum aggregatum TaxID=3036245 RepID=A0ABQ6LDW9_9RHOB|nr:hypothetical protein [Limibaculum sp. NKW23]GMG81555.1 hypothetical protein LNKW23_07680 [Limibaculum sp. NKW23]